MEPRYQTRYVHFASKGELDAYARQMRARYGGLNRVTAMLDSWKRRKAGAARKAA